MISEERRSGLSLGWVLPKPFFGSGGHNNIFHIAEILSGNGHRSTMYCLDTEREYDSDGALERYIQAKWKVNSLKCIRGIHPVGKHDILIATHWSTVAPVLDDKASIRKCYFVQDFEPLFSPVGTEYLLAENTYAYGLPCITLGHWLEHLLRDGYGLNTAGFDFPVGNDVYRLASLEVEREYDIVYYAQPDKPRRAFEIGMKALELLMRSRPQTKIVLFGSEAIAHTPAPFPFENAGLLQPHELAHLYTRTRLGLVLSTTNPSLIPVEMMACGAAVVDLLRENNLYDYDSGAIQLAPQTPEGIAQALFSLLEDEGARQRQVRAALATVANRSYEASGRQVELALLRLLSSNQVSDMPTLQVDIYQETGDAEIKAAAGRENPIRQPFTCHSPNLCRVDLAFRIHGSASGSARMEIQEMGSGVIVAVVEEDCANLKSGHFHPFCFPAIPDSAHKGYVFSLSFDGLDLAEGSLALVYASQPAISGYRVFEAPGRVTNGVLSFRTFCSHGEMHQAPLRAAIFQKAAGFGWSSAAGENTPGVLQRMLEEEAVHSKLAMVSKTGPARSDKELQEKLWRFWEILSAQTNEAGLTRRALSAKFRELFSDSIECYEKQKKALELVEKAKLAVEEKDWKGAEQHVLMALESAPDQVEVLCLHARILAEQNRFVEAARRYKQVIALQNQYAPAYQALGMLSHQLGMEESAIAFLQQSIQADPHFRQAYLDLGKVYSAYQRYEEARDAFLLWLKQDEQDGEIRTELREVYRVLGHADPAREPAKPPLMPVLVTRAERFRVAFYGARGEVSYPIRIGIPAEALKNAGYSISMPDRFRRMDLDRYDVFVFSRPHLDPSAQPAIQACASKGKAIVIDLDDDFHHIPGDHPFYQAYREQYPNLLKRLEALLSLANRVTVSTEPLARVYQKWSSKVAVIPNGWSRSHPLWEAPAPPHDTVNLGWAGTITHREDILPIRPAIQRLIMENPETCLVIGGDLKVLALFSDIPEERRRFIPFAPFEEYPKMLAQFDVLLAPLRLNAFNQSKSDIKLLEAGIRRIPWVASPTEPYLKWGEGGLVAKSPDEWYRQLKRLASSPELRLKLGEAGRRKAETRESARLAEFWMNLIDDLSPAVPGKPAQPAGAAKPPGAAAETLNALLNADDLMIALQEHQEVLDDDLLSLVQSNAETARADGDVNLAEGLEALAEYVGRLRLHPELLSSVES
jgi:glycosyltransferase involved in cell wall biosynthesis